MSIAYLSLGSNLGDRVENLAAAVRKLDAAHTRVLRVSSVYETAPQGKTDQPNFLNIALEVETELSARQLLGHAQSVEQALGRVRKERWGPRIIDLDIVLYGDLTLPDEELTLPHPRMHQRAFVLIPMLEVNPELPLQQYLMALPDQGVTLFLDATSFVTRVSGVQ